MLRRVAAALVVAAMREQAQVSVVSLSWQPRHDLGSQGREGRPGKGGATAHLCCGYCGPWL